MWYILISSSKKRRKEAFYDSKDVDSIILNLSAQMRTAKFVPGETCIILDEIQDCPEARTSLKFFKKDGRRIHFASAMSLLGLDDGAGSSTGNGYLDIVDFILQGCVDVQQNLRELYRRVAFNVMFGNTDDHFRNHGFLLTPKGWTLSPAYDITEGRTQFHPKGRKHRLYALYLYRSF